MPPRPLRPKDEALASDGTDAASDTKPSKRRAVSSACIPCRKRKSKCDGNAPSCSTCIAVYRTECFYDQDSDHRRKGALKRDIQSLQQQNDALDVIVASLKALPESDAINLLHSIRNDGDHESIAASLQTNVRLPHSFSPQTLESEFVQHMTPSTANLPSETGSLDSRLSPIRSRTDEAAFTQSLGAASQTAQAWFRTPQDLELIEHLFELYFTWIHPFYHPFSRDQFLADFRNARMDHCSALLVHAMLALGCHYSDRADARSDPQNSTTAGEHYFSEAKKILGEEEKPLLTTVQALAIMSFRETSQGRDSNGYQLTGRAVRTALELGLHLSVIGKNSSPAEYEARKITFWGIFNLETLCSVGLGRLSQLPRAAADIEKPAITEYSETQAWRPYEDANLCLSPSAQQPARQMTFVTCLSSLSELASEMVNTFYAPRERFTSRRLATTYAQYRDWYQNLPDCFRLENTSLPHVLVLHMYYYACVLHLFRPYIKLDLRGADLYPRDTCTFCANEISVLMNGLRAMYGLRRVCLPVTGLLLSASTIHLLNLPNDQSAAHLTQGMHDLQAMSTNHYFAGRCVDIIRGLASKWHIELPGNAPSGSPFRADSAAPSSGRPQSTFFAASIPRQRSSQSGGQSNDSQRTSAGTSESPFGPPTAQPQQQQDGLQDGMYYTDPFAQMDPMQMQSSFWLPFPAQGMPTLQPQSTGNVEMFGFGESQPVDHWHSFHMDESGGAGAGAGAQQQRQDHFQPRQSASGPSRIVNERIGGNIGSWNWQ